MDTTITVGGLIEFGLYVLCIGAILYGLFYSFAAGMASAPQPEEGRKALLWIVGGIIGLLLLIFDAVPITV